MQAVRIDWLDAIPAAIFLVQGQHVVFANRCAVMLTGCSAGELAGISAEALLVGLETGDGWLHSPCKRPIPVSLTAAEVDHEGQPARLITALARTLPKADEASAKHLSEEFGNQAGLLDEILAATPDSFILFDPVGRFLYVNPSGYVNTQMTPERVIGRTWREIGSFPEPVGLAFDARLEHVFTTGESITYEERFPTLEGMGDFLTTLTPIHDEQNNVVYALNTIRDITARKRAETETRKLAQELEQQARVFDEVLSTTPDNFLMFDRDGKLVYASPSTLRDIQRTSQEVVGRTWSEIGLSAADASRFEAIMARVFADGEPSFSETTLQTPRGLRDFERIFSPLHDRDGQVVAIVVTDRDMTERKRIEKALHENQRLFTSIFETALAGIAVLNAAGRYVQVNRAFCDIYGYNASELIGRHFSLVYRPENREQARLMHERLIAGDITDPILDWTAIHKSGREIEISAYSSLLVREDRQRFRVVAVVDVTAQKQAQRALEASEQRLTSILDSMEDVVWSVTAAGHHLFYANPAIETLTGYSAEDFTVNERLLVEIVHPDEQARFSAQLDRVLGTARTDTEYRILRRDGATRWVHNRFWTVSGASGQRVDGIMTDITDRKRAAEQAMQLAFERERVRILSDFVRDASHEFRTPLSVINTRLYLMERVHDAERQAEFIGGVREQAERILKLVESLIAMSRLDSMSEMNFEHIDLNEALATVTQNLEELAQRKNVGFTLEMTPEALPIQGETDELTDAIRAIFDNAINFTPSGGQVSVRTQRLNNDEVAVDVRDTGIGISSADLPHIFERFYRVDPARTNRGFGLGLPIARKIVEMHHGRIEVESQPATGSRFRLIFPLDSRPALA